MWDIQEFRLFDYLIFLLDNSISLTKIDIILVPSNTNTDSTVLYRFCPESNKYSITQIIRTPRLKPNVNYVIVYLIVDKDWIICH